MEPKRNEPCTCGSGKKYKRCCGKPKESYIKPIEFNKKDPLKDFDNLDIDPNKMDPKTVKKVTNALKRMPKSRLNKLQNLMKKSMKDQDIPKNSKNIEKLMPNELKDIDPKEENNINENKAKDLIKKAVKSGQISKEKGEELLGEKKKSIFSKLFRKK